MRLSSPSLNKRCCLFLLSILGLMDCAWTADVDLPPTATDLAAIEEPADKLPVDALALLDGEILFGLGEFELTPSGERSLVRLIKDLERFSGILSIRIIGHTDSVGSAGFNLALSQRRADWIRDQFISLYPNARVQSIGAGESSPLSSNHTAAGRARNRRVEVQVIATGRP